jgi:hypothetical protein
VAKFDGRPSPPSISKRARYVISGHPAGDEACCTSSVEQLKNTTRSDISTIFASHDKVSAPSWTTIATWRRHIVS